MKGIISLFLLLMIGACSTSPSINGYCEYVPVFHYKASDLPEDQKDNIRKNNYVYDVKCLNISYTSKE